MLAAVFGHVSDKSSSDCRGVASSLLIRGRKRCTPGLPAREAKNALRGAALGRAGLLDLSGGGGGAAAEFVNEVRGALRVGSGLEDEAVGSLGTGAGT